MMQCSTIEARRKEQVGISILPISMVFLSLKTPILNMSKGGIEAIAGPPG